MHWQCKQTKARETRQDFWCQLNGGWDTEEASLPRAFGDVFTVVQNAEGLPKTDLPRARNPAARFVASMNYLVNIYSSLVTLGWEASRTIKSRRT